jgi:hypothetical protein
VRPEVDEEEQDEDRDRSQRDGLQKAEKNFTESHCSIMSARVGGGDVTTRVDLTCRQDGWGGKPRALNPTTSHVIPASDCSLSDSSF